MSQSIKEFAVFSSLRSLVAVVSVVALLIPGHARSDRPNSARPDRAAASDTRIAKDKAEPAADIQQRIAREYASLEKLYKQLHANPELSYQEEQTAARMAGELKKAGFDVTTKVGGHGVVGVFKNGPGPTIMVRCDMDGLPITEATGLAYASKVRTRDKDGNEVGVMHACGHDMHMTCWVGTARLLTDMKDQWSGTLVFIAQPAEESGGGARRMISDGLFKRFPRPDYCLGLHCMPGPVGTISYSEGVLLANVDTVDITVRGKGGHGAAPHTTVDPLVLAARLVLDLQTLVSREISPTDPAVVTVGSIHGGTKHNIIPAEVKLQVTVRSLKDEVRKHLLDGIARICKTAAEGARAPQPIIRVALDDFTPAVYNDAALARKTAAHFKKILGDENVRLTGPIMGGEDFSRYGREGIPIFFYFIGTIDQARFAKAKQGGTPLAAMHSDSYYPAIDGSIKTGVLAMSAAVLNLAGKTKKGASADVPELIRALASIDPEIRREAILNLRELGPKAEPAAATLVKFLGDAAQPKEVRIDAAMALASIGACPAAKAALPKLAQIVENRKEPAQLRERTIWALRVHKLDLIPKAEVMAAFAKVLDEPANADNKMVRYDSCYMLCMLKGEEAPDKALDVLLEFLKDATIAIYEGRDKEKRDARIMAIQALERSGVKRVQERADIVAKLQEIERDETLWSRLRSDARALLKSMSK
jgi:amidohydrolase